MESVDLEEGPLSSSRRVIALAAFGLGFLVDMTFVVFAVINRWGILLLLTILLLPIAYYALLKWWNIDERTQEAYNNAARDSVLIFLVLTFLSSAILLVANMMNDGKYWRELSVLVIMGFLLVFLQGLTAVVYETKYR